MRSEVSRCSHSVFSATLFAKQEKTGDETTQEREKKRPHPVSNESWRAESRSWTVPDPVPVPEFGPIDGQKPLIYPALALLEIMPGARCVPFQIS